MASLLEVQSGRDGTRQGNATAGDPRARALLRRAEGLWGGPLPGRVVALQDGPIRAEISGQPPVRMLRALGLPLECSQVQHYWQLRLEARTAGVYHRRTGMVPLPALPAGLGLPSPPYAQLKQTVCWDTGRVLGFRVYVEEWAEGLVAAAWPGLAPPAPAGLDPASVHTAYGLDYAGDLQVVNIERYDTPLDSLTAGALDLIAIRHACLGRTAHDET